MTPSKYPFPAPPEPPESTEVSEETVAGAGCQGIPRLTFSGLGDPAARSLPKGFSVCFYDRRTGETVACPRDYEVETIGRAHYLFRKGEVAYAVDLEGGTCTCPDFLVRKAGKAGSSCKHVRLARALSHQNQSTVACAPSVLGAGGAGEGRILP